MARRRRSAFSLVEVVLAVGVISFAFVAILGLLPAGLNQFRQAMDASVGAQIAQRIILECQQTDFDVLTDSADSRGSRGTPGDNFRMKSYAPTDLAKVNWHLIRYFDEQGNEIYTQDKIPTKDEALNIVYHVNTRIMTSTSFTQNGGGSDSTGNPVGLSFGVATVLVQVAFNPSNKALDTYPDSANDRTSNLLDLKKRPGVTVKNYCAQVARND
jgi:type II secretory pathway pseudopilin PulG